MRYTTNTPGLPQAFGYQPGDTLSDSNNDSWRYIEDIGWMPKPSKQLVPKRRDLSTLYSGGTVTVTLNTTAASVTAGFVQPHNILSACDILGCATVYSSSANTHICQTTYPQNALVGVESLVFGNKFSLRFQARENLTRFYWVFVNGKPVTAAPQSFVTASLFQIHALDIALPDVGPNLVTVYIQNVFGFNGVGTDATGALMPSNNKLPKVCIVGDSFVGGNAVTTSAFDTMAGLLAVQYGYDVLNCGYGGTGWANPGPGFVFGDASRVKAAELFNPDEVLFFGSVNDTSLFTAALPGAITQTIEKFAASTSCPISVIGVQPTGATETLGTSLVPARVLYDMVRNNSKVGKYLDPIGAAHLSAVPAAFAAGTYKPGALVTANSCVWELQADAATTFTATQGPLGTDASSLPHRWVQKTLWLHGTGNVSSGSGTRALFLGSDNTHYTAAGNKAMAATVDKFLG